MDPAELAGQTGAPAAEVAPPVADQVPGSGTQETDGPLQIGGVELPFTLEEISEDFNLTGEDARAWLRARQAQMQAGFTRATQTLAEQRQQVEEAVALAESLESDDTRMPALRALLNRFGYDLPEDPEEPQGFQGLDPEDELAQRIAALEAEREQEREQQTQSAAEEAFSRRTVDDMNTFAQQYGFEDATLVPEHIREDVLARAVVAPRLADGGLDFATAVAGYLSFVEQEQAQAAARAEYLAGKRDTGPGIVAGSSGDPAIDLSTREARLERANAVAGRHL